MASKPNKDNCKCLEKRVQEADGVEPEVAESFFDARITELKLLSETAVMASVYFVLNGYCHNNVNEVKSALPLLFYGGVGITVARFAKFFRDGAVAFLDWYRSDNSEELKEDIKIQLESDDLDIAPVAYSLENAVCPYCSQGFVDKNKVVGCMDCNTYSHAECWGLYSGCPTMNCGGKENYLLDEE